MALIAVLGFALGGSASAGSSEFGPPKKTDRLLREMRAHLDDAADTNLPSRQKRAIHAAKNAKDEFVSAMFSGGSGQSLFGCGSNDSTNLFFGLDALDRHAEMARRGAPKDRDRWLNLASQNARVIAGWVAACPEADEGARAIARDIANRAASLAQSQKDGDLTDRELNRGVARIASAKRRLLTGQTIYDCDAFGIYSLVKDVDLRLLEALEAGGGDRRATLLAIATRSANELIELWKGVPCDTDCSDGKDNDGDGLIDAGDFGCQTGPGAAYDRSDHSEQHHDPEMNCATLPVGGPRNTFIQQPNSGARIIRFNLRNVTDGTVLVERTPADPDFDLSQPIPLGTGVCGPGTTATVEWVRNGMAMSWHLATSKDNAGVMPAAKQIIVAADTR